MPSLPHLQQGVLHFERVAARISEDFGVTDAVLGIFAFVIGFFMTFFGRKFLKTLIFCLGFMVGGVVSLICLPPCLRQIWICEPKTVSIITYILTLIVALSLGFLAHLFWKIAVFLAGGAAGLLIGGWTIILFPQGFIEEYLSRNWYLGLTAFIGGMLSMTIEAYVVMGTSIIFGSTTMTYGMDKFLNLGFSRYLQHMIQYDYLTLERLPATGWGLLAAGLGFAMCGLLVQCKQYKKAH